MSENEELSSENNNWLLFSLLLDGEGGARHLSIEETACWTPDQGVLWLHLNLPAPETKEFLENKSGINPMALESLTEEEEDRPRCVSFGDKLMLFLRAINLNPGEEPDDMIPLRIWCETNRMITLRETPMNFLTAMEREFNTGVGAKNVGELLDELCSFTLDKIVAVVSDVEVVIDSVEDKIIDDVEDEEGEFMPQLSEARRNLTEMRRYLYPQRDAMDVLPRQIMPWLSAENRYQLRENANRMLRIIEDIDSLRERAMINMDELSNRVREQTQENMYMLSVLAAVFVPLTFITGLFGMNVGGIPLATSENGFLIATLLLLVLGVFLAFLLKRLKWY